jgi:hypothetical protein
MEYDGLFIGGAAFLRISQTYINHDECMGGTAAKY